MMICAGGSAERKHIAPVLISVGAGEPLLRRAWVRPMVDRSNCPSRLAKYEVHDPAPANVWTGTATVSQHVLVVAPGVLERIRENGHRGELPHLVHLARE